MNIMYLIFSFNTGGIERLLIDLTREMSQRGNRVSLCVINHDYTDSLLQQVDPSVRVILLNRRPGGEGISSGDQASEVSNFQAASRLADLIHQDKIRILHCQGLNCVLFAALAKVRNPHLVILNTVHDQGNYRSYSRSKIFLSNRLLDGTIAISNSVRNEILARGLHPDRVVTIYNAIDTERFHYTPDTSEIGENIPGSSNAVDGMDIDRGKARCSRIAEGRIEIGNVARFFPVKKGQDLLVKAVELLLPEYPRLHCSFAGEIYKGQEQAYQTLTEYIRSRGLEDHFTFLGNVDDVPSFLHGCDLFALPSRYEGFGISLIEALACGLPSVASRLDGPAEIMRYNYLGELSDPDNAESLANALRTAIRRLQDHEYDPKRISDYAVNTYNIRNMAEQHAALYEKLLH